MPSTTQIVPEHEYAHVMVVTHDNSARPNDKLGKADNTYCNMMYVFSSPKGIDRELLTVSGGETPFVEKFGIGTYDVYGQPFLNALASAKTNAATLHCLRVTADNASYSVGALVAHYKVTPGTSGNDEPVVTPSLLVDTLNHENVVATDNTDEVNGNILITIAGTGVEPGISAENQPVFGDLAGKYIDVVINIGRIIDLDPVKSYQVTQENPCLAEYVGKDPYISEVNGTYKKVKTYTGDALAEGLAIILGEDTDTVITITEWGTNEPVARLATINVINNTDLGVKLADPEAKAKVTQSGINFTITGSGEAVPSLIHPDQFGSSASDDAMEVNVIFPGVDPDKDYRVVETNSALSRYPGDPAVSVNSNVWSKVKNYKGADIVDGYALLMGNGTGDATLSLHELTEDTSPIQSNTTDLGFSIADPDVKVAVTQSGSTNYNITLSGEIVPGLLNPDLFPGATGKNVCEAVIEIPNLVDDHTYTITQRNPVLSMYSDDPYVNTEPGFWRKVKTYTGAELKEGYNMLVSDQVGVISLTVIDTTDSGAIMTASIGFRPTLTWVDVHGPRAPIVGPTLYGVQVANGWTFVDEHTPEIPQEGPIGDPITILVDAAFAFTVTTERSAMLRAAAKARAVVRDITDNTNTVEAKPGRMDVYYTFEIPDKPLYDYKNASDDVILGNEVQVDPAPDANGYRAVKIFEICARGRGSWGNNIRWKLESYARGDRLSQFKNYTLSIYEINNATLTKKEEFTVSFSPSAVNADGDTLFADYLIGDPFDNSSYVVVVSNPMAFQEMYAAYAQVCPDTSLTAEKFDPLIGRQFGTSMQDIDSLYIDTTSNGVVSISGASGVALGGGSDGDFDPNSPNRDKAMAAAYLRAYSGEIDRNVRSKKMFPTDVILDANFDTATKEAIHNLVVERQDCMGVFDLGIKFNTFAGLMEELADLEVWCNNRNETIEGYRGKIQDPLSWKIVPVTSTYALASMLPLHFQQHGDKHVPMAGSSYGIMSGFISGTAWPVYDDDLDSKIMDQLTESKVNFLKVNTRKQVVRGAQTTRQDADTNLSEMSNVFILLDIRRDAIQICEQYEYNFAREQDLQRFNKSAKLLAEKYQDNQVKQISAEFDMNDWESERGILHLYIDFVHENIIKRAIVEINVNRGVVEP